MILPILLTFMLTTTDPSGSPQIQEPPAVVLDDIVVTAPNRAAVEAFVDILTDSGPRGGNRGQIARWGEPICLRIIGGPHADNERLRAAVGDVFASLNIRSDRPACRPNVMVVIADDADGFARAISSRSRNRFFQNRRQIQAEFVAASAPVRWEHRTRVGAAGRSPLIDERVTRTSGEPIELPNSRITQSTSERIERAMIVVNARRIAQLPLDSLAAYIAFVTLVDAPMGANIAERTSILNLFETPGIVSDGLSDWDRAFIESLYSIQTDVLFPMQRLELEQRMARALDATD